MSNCLWPTRLLCPWNSLDKNIRVGCHVLLKDIFPTQGSNPTTLHCWTAWWLRWERIILQCRRLRFNPWVGKIPWRRKWQLTSIILWVQIHGDAKSQTRLSDQHFHFHSCIAGIFLTIWTIREALRLIMAPTDLPQFSDPCLASPNPSISFSFPSLAHHQGPTTALLTTL